MMHTRLSAQHIVITRAAEQAEEFATQLRELGATPIICPAIAFVPPDDPAALASAIANVASYDWVMLTSAQAAHVFQQTLSDQATIRNVRVAAVGPATAQTLTDYGFTVDLVPIDHSAEGLLAALGAVAGQRVLLPAADIARSTLADGLRTRGAHVDPVIAYRTVPGPGGAILAPLLQANIVDAVTFTSSSTVRYLLNGIIDTGMTEHEAVRLLNTCLLACIGPATAATARKHGLVVTEAEPYTTEGLVVVLVKELGVTR